MGAIIIKNNLDEPFQPRSEAELDNILLRFGAMIDNLSHLTTNELVNLKIASPEFSGSYALDLSIARNFLSRSEYKQVSRVNC